MRNSLKGQAKRNAARTAIEKRAMLRAIPIRFYKAVRAAGADNMRRTFTTSALRRIAHVCIRSREALTNSDLHAHIYTGRAR